MVKAPSQIIQLFTHSKVCLAVAIHNSKQAKVRGTECCFTVGPPSSTSEDIKTTLGQCPVFAGYMFLGASTKD